MKCIANYRELQLKFIVVNILLTTVPIEKIYQWKNVSLKRKIVIVSILICSCTTLSVELITKDDLPKRR